MTAIPFESAELALQNQLFRYAQDLQELMEQHGKLQLRYQGALQAQGRVSLRNDLLLSCIRHGNSPYLVTDASGLINQVSSSMEPLLGESGLGLRGCSLMQLVSQQQREYLMKLLARLVDSETDGAIIQSRLSLSDGQKMDHESHFDVLVVPRTAYGQTDYIWLMQRCLFDDVDSIEALEKFDLLNDNSCGLLVTDAKSQVRTINPAYTQITGYHADDIIGRNPKVHASGRHSADFYADFWAELSSSGSWSGEFFNRRKNGQIYPEWKTIKAVKSADGITFAYLSVFVDGSQQHNEADQLTRMAYHDALTGLPNRRLLEDRLAHALNQAQRDGPGLTLLFIDLDRFKPINDRLGHEVGDEVLQEVGKRLRKSLRQGDTVARVGGDEFVILLQNAVRSSHIQNIVHTILSKISEPISVREHHLLIGASIGCARYPQDGSDSASLLKHADGAMYAAKRHGGSHFCFHESKGQHDAMGNLGRNLWLALTHDELHLMYQPQVDTSGKLHGCEALLRWSHPSLGDIPPSTFIPIAETNGAILPLGDWVLETACRQLQQWHQAGWHNLTMSVNVSPRQLTDPGFAQRVCQILLSTGVVPRALELEITEAEALRNVDNGQQLLQPLRDMGVRIAIDDFGTGYSSLSRLQNLSVDCLKIDQNFVRNIATNRNARAITQCFISMGLAMGIDVIAEGVETQEQLEVLSAQGCHLIQGFFTGRPMASNDMLIFCQRSAPLQAK